MLPLQLGRRDGAKPLRVLALGAHSDDIEIGCGATMLLLQRAAKIDVTWVVFGAAGVREDEAHASADAFLASAASASVHCHAFRDGYFPHLGDEVKDVFEELKGELDPDVIFTHSRTDLHQDHRLVNELTWNTFRDHLVLEYEVPKYDGDLGAPNAFVPVSEDVAREKAELLVRHFTTQRGKHWFDEELFLGLMRLRGAEAGSSSRYAEAFYSRKLVLAADGVA